jgi:hypothetical protein
VIAEDPIGDPSPASGVDTEHLTADIEAALDMAVLDRIMRVSCEHGISVRRAAVVVIAEIRGAR